MSQLTPVAAMPRVVSFSSPVLFRDPLKTASSAVLTPETAVPARPATAHSGSGVRHAVNGAVSSVAGWMGKAFEAYDAAKDGVELIRNGLYWRKLRREFEDTSAADQPRRYVFDAKGWCRLPPDAVLVRKEGDPATGDTDTDLAYEHVGYAFDFLKRRMNVVLSGPLVQVINYNNDENHHGLDNAMFQPFLFGANYLIFGKGDDKTHHSMVRSIDIVGHEAWHKVLSEIHPGKFDGGGQTAAINEHLCDVVGTCIKAERQGVTGAYPEGFWRFGAGYMIDPDLCVRDMMNPENGGLPAHMSEFIVTDEDDGGAHLNAGILDRLFALFCTSVKSPCYEAPLEIWKMAMDIVNSDPSFRDFGKALVYATMQYDEAYGTNMRRKMLTACRKVGLTEYAVVDGEVLALKKMRAVKSGESEGEG